MLIDVSELDESPAAEHVGGRAQGGRPPAPRSENSEEPSESNHMELLPELCDSANHRRCFSLKLATRVFTPDHQHESFASDSFMHSYAG